MTDWKDCKTSGEMMRHVLLHHHISWRGEPVQATTYSMSRWEFFLKLRRLVDTAIEESMCENEDKHEYRTVTELETKRWK